MACGGLLPSSVLPWRVGSTSRHLSRVERHEASLAPAPGSSSPHTATLAHMSRIALTGCACRTPWSPTFLRYCDSMGPTPWKANKTQTKSEKIRAILPWKWPVCHLCRVFVRHISIFSFIGHIEVTTASPTRACGRVFPCQRCTVNSA